MYTIFIEDEECVEILHKCMNNELNRNIKPESWSKSKTIMLPKSKKPTAAQLRPIALTDSSYKICMALIKSRVEKHLASTGATCTHFF